MAISNPSRLVSALQQLVSPNGPIRTARAILAGVSDGSDAAPGDKGESPTNQTLLASAVALTTGVASNVVGISLTAGDWDVSGVVNFVPTVTTSITFVVCGISSVSATTPGVDSGAIAFWQQPATVPGGVAGYMIATPVVRFSLLSTATAFLVASSNFTVSTLKACGTIRARRIR